MPEVRAVKIRNITIMKAEVRSCLISGRVGPGELIVDAVTGQMNNKRCLWCREDKQ